jgi:hypothetical protein
MAERAALLRLAAEVRADLDAAARLLDELARHAPRSTPGDVVHHGYVAVTLHQVYTALESGFERICRTLEGSPPGGPDSHAALLRDMTFELEGIRPAVLRAETAAVLLPLLRFRHFVRHSYTLAWDPQRLDEVTRAARQAWPAVHADVSAFLDFLRAAAAALAE